MGLGGNLLLLLLLRRGLARGCSNG